MTWCQSGGSHYTLTYNQEKHLTGVSEAATASFVYDADGQRVKGTVGSTTTVYVGGHYEKTGSTIRKYYALGEQRVAMRENGVVSWLLTDALGSTAVTANAREKRSWRKCVRASWGFAPPLGIVLHCGHGGAQ